MPVELLEKEVEVAEVARDIPRIGAVQQSAVRTPDQQTKDQNATGKKPQSIWHKIFEGHEEMLGWTPD